MTTSPYSTRHLQFLKELPEDPLYGPDVVLQVWDADRMGTNTHMALLRMPMSELEELSSEAARPPEPTWRALVRCVGRAVWRELLCCGARIRKHSTKEKNGKTGTHNTTNEASLGGSYGAGCEAAQNLQLTNAVGTLCQSGGPRPWRWWG